MGEKHSAVGYLFREGAFLPAQETKPVRNEFGLDLFQHRGSVYEGKTGLQFCSLQQAEDLAGFVEKHGGMQLFREHEIPVPLKTQGWIINSLHSIRYEPQNGEWHYRYFKGSRNSTKMFDLLSQLSAAIQTRQQFEEHGASPPDSPVLDCEEEQDMEL